MVLWGGIEFPVSTAQDAATHRGGHSFTAVGIESRLWPIGSFHVPTGCSGRWAAVIPEAPRNSFRL